MFFCSLLALREYCSFFWHKFLNRVAKTEFFVFIETNCSVHFFNKIFNFFSVLDVERSLLVFLAKTSQQSCESEFIESKETLCGEQFLNKFFDFFQLWKLKERFSAVCRDFCDGVFKIARYVLRKMLSGRNFSTKKLNFFHHFRTLIQKFLFFIVSFSADLSKLHSTCPEEDF